MSESAPEPELEESAEFPVEEGDAGVNDTGDEPWYEDSEKS
jgi:hypothetical protein